MSDVCWKYPTVEKEKAMKKNDRWNDASRILQKLQILAKKCPTYSTDVLFLFCLECLLLSFAAFLTKTFWKNYPVSYLPLKMFLFMWFNFKYFLTILYKFFRVSYAFSNHSSMITSKKNSWAIDNMQPA